MARQEAWPGFGERIRQRIRALGYVRPNGSEDISRFTLSKGYIVTLFYKYLSNTTPNRETLLRLAQDLEVSPAWLLFGDEGAAKPRRPTAARGGQGREKPLRVEGTSSLKEKHTPSSVSARKDATLCQPRGRTMVRGLQRSAGTATRGIRSRVA